MDNEKNQVFTATKIEVDDKSNEPIFVDLNEEEYNSELERQVVHKKEGKEEKVFDTKHAKQAVMNKVFGIPSEEDINRRQKILKRIVSIVFIVLVVGVLAYTFYNDFFTYRPDKEVISFQDVSSTLLNNWYYFAIAVFCFSLTLLFKGSKLSVLCKVLTKKFCFKTCFETGIIGAYYNNVTPLAVGGQPFEIYHLTKNGIHGGTASSMPIVAFFLNQVAFVVLSIASISLLKFNNFEFTQTLPVVIKTMAIVGLVLCMLVPTMVITFSMMPNFCGAVIKFVANIGAKLKIVKDPDATSIKTIKNVMHNSNCIKKIASSPFGFILSILLSFCEQLANVSIAYFTLKFFGFDIPERGIVEWLFVCQLCFVLYSAISFIPTPGNSGAADISFYTLFSAGIEVAGLAFPALMVWRLLSFYSIIILGFLFIKARNHRERKLKLNQ